MTVAQRLNIEMPIGSGLFFYPDALALRNLLPAFLAAPSFNNYFRERKSPEGKVSRKAGAPIAARAADHKRC